MPITVSSAKIKQVQRLFKAGKLQEAYALSTKLINRFPDNAGLYHLTAKIVQAARNFTAASNLFNQAISLGLRSPDVFADNAESLNCMGQFAQAEGMAQAAVTLDSRNTSALRQLLQALFAQGKYSLALPHARELLASRSIALRDRLLIARNHACLGQYSQAIEIVEAALDASPDAAEAHLLLSQILLDVREWDRAAHAADSALNLAPGDAAVISNKAHILEHQGEYEAAFALIDPLINGVATARGSSLHIGAVHVYARLAKRYGKLEHAIELLEKAVEQDALSVGMRHTSLNLLGASYDALGAYDKAFKAIDAANKQRPNFFDDAAHEASVNSMIGWFTKERVSSMGVANQLSNRPIFIVGMPRSGTSLTEKILARHSAVDAGGELPFIAMISQNELPVMLAVGDAYPANLRALNVDVANEAAALYLEQALEQIAGEAERFTDKMPMNFLYLGLIATLFPEAKIINCTRDPMAVGLSCYMANFASATDMGFTQDLECTGRYIRRYERLMAHWHAVLPNPILDLSYEALVSNPNEEIARLLEFCELPWEDACLTPQHSTGTTMTASYNQVRQAINTRSVAHWQHYEKQLVPLKQGLNISESAAA